MASYPIDKSEIATMPKPAQLALVAHCARLCLPVLRAGGGPIETAFPEHMASLERSAAFVGEAAVSELVPADVRKVVKSAGAAMETVDGMCGIDAAVKNASFACAMAAHAVTETDAADRALIVAKVVRAAVATGVGVEDIRRGIAGGAP